MSAVQVQLSELTNRFRSKFDLYSNLTKDGKSWICVYAHKLIALYSLMAPFRLQIVHLGVYGADNRRQEASIFRDWSSRGNNLTVYIIENLGPRISSSRSFQTSILKSISQIRAQKNTRWTKTSSYESWKSSSQSISEKLSKLLVTLGTRSPNKRTELPRLRCRRQPTN
jgi:hypothetical protein